MTIGHTNVCVSPSERLQSITLVSTGRRYPCSPLNVSGRPVVRGRRLMVSHRLFEASAKPYCRYRVLARSADCYRRHGCGCDEHDNGLGYPRFVVDCLVRISSGSSFANCLVTKVKLLCVLASQDGLQHVQDEFPGLEVRLSSSVPGMFCLFVIGVGSSCGS